MFVEAVEDDPELVYTGDGICEALIIFIRKIDGIQVFKIVVAIPITSFHAVTVIAHEDDDRIMVCIFLNGVDQVAERLIGIGQVFGIGFDVARIRVGYQVFPIP